MYRTVGFKETEAQVYLTTAPITAKILEVERFTRAPDRFKISKHRGVSKVCGHTLVKRLKDVTDLTSLLCLQAMPAVFKIELKHGNFTWIVKRKEKHFMDLHRELLRYKTLMRIPLPTRRSDPCPKDKLNK